MSQSIISASFKKTLLLLVLVGLHYTPSLTHAYEFTGSQWVLSPGSAIPYIVNEVLSEDLADNDCLAGVQLGYQVWNDVSCSYMLWQYQGRTQNNAWSTGDGENVVSWRDDTWDDSATTLAITSSIFDFQGLSDTDIKFNGFNHQWSMTSEGDGIAGGVDVASVNAHEVGHALGLDHSAELGATMWPSTGPGDDSPRSLSQDDVNGVCALYDTGNPPPDIPDDPSAPQAGTVGFGEDCSQEYCAAPYFCVTDGRESYCSQTCDDSMLCPEDYFCAELSGNSGACALGEPPVINQAGFGEECGEQIGCEPGLSCISDGTDTYCSAPCNQDMCPEGYLCAELQGGGNICARGSEEPLPELGEECGEGGRCADGLFCLSDQLNTDPNTGQVVAYCSQECPRRDCPDDYRCIDVQPSGTACQKVPSAGNRQLGDECWINPESPYDDPICPDGLRCINSQRDPNTMEFISSGTCTQTCSPTNCCPQGWGCQEILLTLTQCTIDVDDDPNQVCEGQRPVLSDPDESDALDEMEVMSKGASDEGCQSLFRKPSSSLSILMLLAIIAIRRRLISFSQFH
jgi:hypothetical protein